jgi:hypothetical protein
VVYLPCEPRIKASLKTGFMHLPSRLGSNREPSASSIPAAMISENIAIKKV